MLLVYTKPGCACEVLCLLMRSWMVCTKSGCACEVLCWPKRSWFVQNQGVRVRYFACSCVPGWFVQNQGVRVRYLGMMFVHQIQVKWQNLLEGGAPNHALEVSEALTLQPWSLLFNPLPTCCAGGGLDV